jgi:hypothetical protein
LINGRYVVSCYFKGGIATFKLRLLNLSNKNTKAKGTKVWGNIPRIHATHIETASARPRNGAQAHATLMRSSTTMKS